MDGLLRIVKDHAQRVLEASREDMTPDTDEVLLRLLTELVMDLRCPTPTELLAKAREVEPDLFAKYTPRGVSRTLDRYGIRTRHGKERRYDRVGPFGEVTPKCPMRADAKAARP